MTPSRHGTTLASAVLVAVVLVLTAACAAPAAEPTAAPTAEPTKAPLPTAPPTEPPTAEPTPEPTEPEPEAAVDPIWARVQDTGRLIVGTSADYPPFAYYPPGTTVDCSELPMEGFDVALVRDLARHFGVQVEFRDFVFDGLLNAVQVQQIDMAIGAISVGPGREEMVRFSNVYYVGEDAVLALEESDTAVGSIIDLVGHTVAVQKGSVHHTWIQLGLVDTGEMAASDLVTFSEADDSMALLTDGTAEFVIMDYLPAMEFARAEEVKIVAHGLNKQLYGIAMHHGAPTLAFEVNKALAQLDQDGKIAILAAEHLGLGPGDLIDLPTPSDEEGDEPTEVPPSEGCIDSMALVEELTEPVPELGPGETFARVFRVRNTGTCDWDARYVLDFGGGNVDEARMGGEPIEIADGAAAGETVDLELQLTAPNEAGDYQGYWNMVSPRGVTFGERIYISLTVFE